MTDTMPKALLLRPGPSISGGVQAVRPPFEGTVFVRNDMAANLAESCRRFVNLNEWLKSEGVALPFGQGAVIDEARAALAAYDEATKDG